MKKDKIETANLKLKHVVLIGKFDDGTCRQVFIYTTTQNIIFSAIVACEGEIRVSDQALHGVDVEVPA